MRIFLLTMPFLMISCAAIRESKSINAPQPVVREAIATDVIANNGLIIDDTKYTIKAEVPNPNRVEAFLSSGQLQQWVFNVSGDSPTNVTLMPFNRVGYGVQGVYTTDSTTLTAVKNALVRIEERSLKQ